MKVGRGLAAIGTCLALVMVAGAPSALSAVPTGRPAVVNGTPITAADAPWQALLLINNGGSQSLCSGALISPTAILSVAHCLQGVSPTAVQAWLGETRMSEAKPKDALPIAGVSVHPGYDANTLANDIAIIQLASPVDLTTGARVIGLPFGQDPASWPAAGTPATIAGWGATSTNGQSSDQLLRGSVQVLSGPGAPCGQYGATFNAGLLICGGLPSGAVDTCQGDSGGPFTVDNAGVTVLAGLTSNGAECASAIYPGLYTRVTSFLPWIQQGADVATAPPGQPTAVTAEAKSGKMQVSWTAPAGAGAGSTVWTVTAQPGGATCRTTGSSCPVAGLRAGSQVTFTVQGTGPLGAGPAGSSEAVRVATTEARRGASVPVRSLASWLGLRGAAKATSRTAGTCIVKGNRVRLLKSGACNLVVSAGGKRRPAVIAID